jgi:type I restriction enzyme S subunit
MTKLTFNKVKSTEAIWLPQIPEHWELVKVRHLFKESTLKGFPNETLLVASQEHGVVSKEAYGKRTVEATKDLHNLKLVEQGDFVISLRSFQGGIEVAHERGIISPAYTVMKETRPLDKRFFKNLFKSPPFISLMTLCVKGIREGQNIDYPTFKNEYLPFPPLEEQQAIAAYLDKKNNKIDKFIKNKERLIELLEERKKKVISKNISQWIHSELKESSISWIGKIPTNWNVLNLKYLLKSKLKYGANEEAKDANPEHPRYIRITDFGFDGKLSDDTFRSLPLKKAKEYLLNEGDILFARSGATVGKTFQFKGYNGLACFAGYLIKASPNSKKILSDFLYLYTQSSFFEEWKNGVFDKATIENIGADKYAVLKVIVPPIDEQNQIIAFVQNESSEINLAILKAHQEISSIKEYREALITDLVTGKRRDAINRL